MGITKVAMKLMNMEGNHGFFEDIFLIDTGATDSMAPSDELEKIGANPIGKMSYELADGTVKEYQYGLVRIEFMGEITALWQSKYRSNFRCHRTQIRRYRG